MNEPTRPSVNPGGPFPIVLSGSLGHLIGSPAPDGRRVPAGAAFAHLQYESSGCMTPGLVKGFLVLITLGKPSAQKLIRCAQATAIRVKAGCA